MAGNSLGTLSVNLRADTAQFASDLGRAVHVAEADLRKIDRAVKTISGAISIGLATAAAYGVGALVKHAIDGADQLHKLSQRTGIAVEGLSEMKFAAELSGVAVEDMSSATARFNASITEAKDGTSKAGRMFTALGVDIKQGPHAAMLQLGDALRSMPDEARLAAVRELFGSRAGDRMVPFLLGLREASSEARKLGVVISADMARDAEQFNDNMKRLGANVDRLAMKITGNLLPALVKLSENMIGDSPEARANYAAGFGLEPAARLGFQADARRFEPVEPGAGTVNSGEVMCIASGGRWLNGRCVRKEDEERSGELLAARRAALDAEEKIYFAGLQINQQERERLKLLGERSQIEDLLAQERSLEERDEIQRTARLRELHDEANKTKNVARELGMSFQSAFEDAILAGKNLSDTVRALGMDIARIILRLTITQPMAASIAQGVGAIDFRGLFGGGASPPPQMAEGGYLPAGRWALTGEEGPEPIYGGRTGVTVLPNSSLQGGGQVFQVDMRGASLEAVARLERFVMRINGSIEQRAIGAMAAHRRR